MQLSLCPGTKCHSFIQNSIYIQNIGSKKEQFLILRWSRATAIWITRFHPTGGFTSLHPVLGNSQVLQAKFTFLGSLISLFNLRNDHEYWNLTQRCPRKMLKYLNDSWFKTKSSIFMKFSRFNISPLHCDGFRSGIYIHEKDTHKSLGHCSPSRGDGRHQHHQAPEHTCPINPSTGFSVVVT